jgi:hypothetical protein
MKKIKQIWQLEASTRSDARLKERTKEKAKKKSISKAIPLTGLGGL